MAWNHFSFAERSFRRLSTDGFSFIGTDLIGSPSSNSENVLFGATVALSSRNGSFLAVGAPHHDYLTPQEQPALVANNAGAVFVFNYDATYKRWYRSWFLAGKASEGVGDYLSLSEDGSRIAVRRHAPPSVEVYDYKSGRLGSPITTVTSCGSEGQMVTLSPDGQRITISCENASGNQQPGLVVVFQWIGNDWTPIGTIQGSSNNDAFGWSTAFSLNGNKLAISAPNHDAGSLSNCGLVRLFEYDGSRWIQVGNDILGTAAAEQLGYAMDVSEDGYTIAVGSPGASGDGKILNGKVQIFRLSLSRVWSPVDNAVRGAVSGERFGSSVSLAKKDYRFVATASPFGSTPGLLRFYYLDMYGGWIQYGGTISGESISDGFGLGRRALSISGDASILATGASLYNKLGKVQVLNVTGLGNLGRFSLAPTISPSSLGKIKPAMSKVAVSASGVCYLAFGDDPENKRRLQTKLSGNRLTMVTDDEEADLDVVFDLSQKSAVSTVLSIVLTTVFMTLSIMLIALN